MKRLAMVFALSAIATCQVYAQQNSNAPSSGNMGNAGTTGQPGKAGQKMEEQASPNAPANPSDSLMDKRAKAMSPEGASTPGKTGQVSQ